MMKLIAVLSLALVLSACTRWPTETTQVVDDRPRVAFETQNLSGRASAYQLVIDGIDYGSLDQYLAGKNALRIVSGPHRIEVQKNGETVFTENVVLGENTTRIVRVVAHD